MNRTHRLPSVTAGRTSAVSARYGGARRLALGLGLLGLGVGAYADVAPRSAHADIAPPPPPAECVGKPDGTPCPTDNGLPGKCTTDKWKNDPYVHCKVDKHECDRLELGAVCHGYLGRPSHCKEFTNGAKETWRACQADVVGDQVADSPATAPTTSAPAAPPAKKGLSCTAAPGAPASGSTGAAVLWAAALWLSMRRRATR